MADDIPEWQHYGRFSRDDFDRNVTALLSAFAASKNECEPAFALLDWRLSNRHTTDGYLSHPPVTLSSDMSLVANDPVNSIFLATRHESDGNLEDDEIIADDQCYVDETTIHNKTEMHQKFVTQWTFSIVYSPTYQSPVLYFHVQELDGNPVGRQQLLKIIRQEHQRSAFEFSNDFPTDAWEFVSQEEHPVTGLSSFFLHPCQSAQRLQLLTTSVAAEDQKKLSTELERTSNSHDSSKVNLLWVWMSMILPAVGHSIPSSYFRHVQNCIEQHP